MDRVACLVLAGGRGTGFGPIADLRTKAAFPIAGYYRIIDFVLSNLSHSGVRRVGLIIQYLPAPLMEHIGSGRPWDYDMADRQLSFMTPFVGVQETRWFRGTGDAIAQNFNLMQTGGMRDVLIVSGDHAYNMDYRELVAHHRETDADVTMAAVEIPPEHQHPRFGNIVADADGRITRFIEKPEQPVSELVSMGVFIFKRDVLAALLEEAGKNNGNPNYSLAGDILQPGIDRLKAQCFRFGGPWHYIGDMREYFDFHMELARKRVDLFNADWRVMTNFADRMLGSRPPAYVSPEAEVENAVISPGCRIEGSVRDSVLSPGVHIGPGSRVSHCVIMHDGRIGADCRLDHAVCDKDVLLRRGCVIGEQGDSPEGADRPITIIPKGQILSPGSRVAAGETLEQGVPA